MLPETLVALICTLEKSGCCCAAAVCPQTTAAPASERIIQARTLLLILAPPQECAGDSIIASDRQPLFGLFPGRQRAPGEERFGGPLAEIDGERYAVAVITGEKHHLLAARMAAEDGAHFFRQENRAAPMVRNTHGFKHGMQIADAVFEPADTVRGLTTAHIVVAQVARGVFLRAIAKRKARRRSDVRRDEPGAEDDAV